MFLSFCNARAQLFQSVEYAKEVACTMLRTV